MTASTAALLASHPPEVQKAILAELSEAELAELEYNWRFWARPEQIAPDGDWLTWVINAGRGFGKTRAGAEWVREQVESGRRRIAIIGETYKDLVEVMCFGDSGIASVFPEHQRPKIVTNPNVHITFHTGAIALGYNATQPSQLRGPQFDASWADELAKWKKARETWDMLQFGLRLGDKPQALVTTTPRPIPVLKEIMADASTVVTHGSTFDNAGNLAASFLTKVRTRYEGTRLGRQELSAEMLDDVPGALWTAARFHPHEGAIEARRIVVGVDPSGAGSAEESGDDIGIVVAALLKDRDAQGRDMFAILEDATCKLSPSGWGRRAVERYEAHGADCIVAERNFGGAMVESNIRTASPRGRNAKVKMVTASRGKTVRAEPVAALYEQGRVLHMPGLTELEDQMMQMTGSGFVGEGSPDRLDAAVWALTELMGEKSTAQVFL